MKYQSLCFGKNISRCCLLKFYPACLVLSKKYEDFALHKKEHIQTLMVWLFNDGAVISLFGSFVSFLGNQKMIICTSDFWDVHVHYSTAE